MQDRYEQLDNILEERRSDPPVTLAEYMETLRGQTILLYGAGAFGRENLGLFRHYGIEPAAFLDRNAKPGEEKMGVPVYHPDDDRLTPEFRNSCQIYISITLPKRTMGAIKQDLARWGYGGVKAVQSITARQVRFEGAEQENPPEAYVIGQKDKIRLALSLMSDEESVQTYLSCVRAHLLRRYEDCVETDYPCQYFEAGVPLKKGFSCLVDCGAYTGDCLDAVLGRCGSLQTYVAFEPILDNFTLLSKTVDQYGDKIKNAYLFPCGVSDRTGTAHFTLAASASTMSEQGESILPIITLDDALKQVPATMLKMDIEGAEPAALRGAMRMVQCQEPDLAISVYHAANHFWDIPCMIHRFDPHYKFYLRSHTPATLESVLYCTC